MKNYSIACWVMALVALVACEQPVPRTTTAIDFDIAAYVQQETERLQAAQPAVLKSVTTENAPAETIQIEQLNWAEELAIFTEADINKPTLREYYIRQEQTLADGSKVISYNRDPNADAPVEKLHLELTSDNRLQRLEATLHDENLLFFSRRKAVLEASPQTGRLQGYRVNGVQKMIFGDSLHYSVQVNL